MGRGVVEVDAHELEDPRVDGNPSVDSVQGDGDVASHGVELVAARHALLREPILSPAEPEEPVAGLSRGGVAPPAELVLGAQGLEALAQESLHVANPERFLQIDGVALLEPEVADVDVRLVDAGDDRSPAEIVHRRVRADPGFTSSKAPPRRWCLPGRQSRWPKNSIGPWSRSWSFETRGLRIVARTRMGRRRGARKGREGREDS